MAEIVSPGKSSFSCACSVARSRCTAISYRRSAPLRSHTNIEIVPGVLPLTSSWLVEVTSASAMSALVSETREIGVPTSITVERPTRSETGMASDTADAAAAGGSAGGACASTVVDPIIQMMRM